MRKRVGARGVAGVVAVVITVLSGSMLYGVNPAAAAGGVAAAAAVTPAVQYPGDSAGTEFTFVVRNAGSVGTIASVEITRASARQSVLACPTAPPGWTTERTDVRCRYRSAATAEDDIQPGQSEDRFSLVAATGSATENTPGTWRVRVSRQPTFTRMVEAGAEMPGALALTINAIEILDVVIDPAGPVTPGAPCPDGVSTLVPGTGSHTVVICGRNRTTATLRPTSRWSSLSGPLVAAPGTFIAGSLVPGATNVVLGQWTGVVLAAGPVAVDLDLTARVGASGKRTSPATTVGGFQLINTIPAAETVTPVVDEDTPIDVTLTATDADGQELTFDVVTPPAHGVVGSVTPTGCSGGQPISCTATVTYTPDGDYDGPDSFTYTASDGLATSDPATVTVTVNPVNDPPVVASQTVALTERSAVGSPVTTVTYDDPDTGQGHTFAITAGNTGNAFAIDGGTGAVTVADAGPLVVAENPVFTLTVTVTDDGSPPATGSATITVNLEAAPNTAPEITNTATALTVNENSTAVVDVDTTDDQDSEGSGLAYALSGVDAGDLAINPDTGVISFLTAPDYESPADAGTNNVYEVTVTVTDSGALSDTLNLSITVGNVLEASWVQRFGGGQSDQASRVVTDGGGNTYVIGSFAGTADFDSGPGLAEFTSVGAADAYLAKFDPAGALLWVRTFGGTDDDTASGVAVAPNGTVTVTGSFRGSMSIPGAANPVTVNSAGGTDIYVVTYELDGDLVRAVSYGSANPEEGRAVAVDADSRAYVTGATTGFVDFDPIGGNEVNAGGSSDGFVLTLNPDGTTAWVRAFPSSGGSQSGTSVAVDGAGNVIVTGGGSGTVDLDPGPGVGGPFAMATDIYVVKLTSTGDYVWGRVFGGPGVDRSDQVQVDATGRVFVAGAFLGTSDFDPGAGSQERSSAGGADTFLLKLTADGDFAWVNTFGALANDEALGLALDASGNPVITGVFNGTIDVDPGPGTSQIETFDLDAFLVKYSNGDGAVVWARSFGGGGFDRAIGVAVGAGGIRVVGFDAGAADFDPGPGVFDQPGFGGNDAFVVKLDANGLLT